MHRNVYILTLQVKLNKYIHHNPRKTYLRSLYPDNQTCPLPFLTIDLCQRHAFGNRHDLFVCSGRSRMRPSPDDGRGILDLVHVMLRRLSNIQNNSRFSSFLSRFVFKIQLCLKQNSVILKQFKVLEVQSDQTSYSQTQCYCLKLGLHQQTSDSPDQLNQNH